MLPATFHITKERRERMRKFALGMGLLLASTTLAV